MLDFVRAMGDCEVSDSSAISVFLEHASPRRILVRVDDGSAEQRFYFQSPEDLWVDSPESLDFAAIALAQFAASKGRDLHIRGSMCRSQARNLERFIEIWSVWRPERYKPINVIADDWREPSSQNKFDSAVLGFSGGVDATATLILHNGRKLSTAMPRVGLGVFVSGIDIGNEDQAGLATAFASAKKTLSAFNAKAAFISTNWRDHFCPDFPDSHSLLLSSVMRTLSKQHGSGIVASDASYLDDLAVGVYGNHIATNYLLGSSSFPIFTGAGTLTRVERVREICNHPVALNNLRVCYQSHAQGKNCGKCKKCILTRLAVVACGHDPSPMFDIGFDDEDIDRIDIGIHGKIYLDDLLLNLDSSSPYHAKLQALRDRENDKFMPSEHRSLILENQAAIEELSRTRKQISGIKNSRSWRLTKPLRRLLRERIN